MATSALKCRKIILIIVRTFSNYNNILINFGQLYSNIYSCSTIFSIATLGMCTTCEFHRLWAVRPCIYHIIWHLTKWLIFCQTGHASTVIYLAIVFLETKTNFKLVKNLRIHEKVLHLSWKQIYHYARWIGKITKVMDITRVTKSWLKFRVYGNLPWLRSSI